MLFSRSLTLAALGLCLIVAGCDRQGSAPAQPQASASQPGAKGTLDRSHKGSLMPDMALRDLRGGAKDLAELKGKPVLVNLWATWCAPCLAELPTLDGLSQGRKVRVLLVAQDIGPPGKIQQFLAQHGPHLESWIDPDSDLSFHYDAGVLPTTVYYDAQGREVWRMVGERDWSDAASAALLAEAK